MKKLVILGMMVVGMMSFGMEREDEGSRRILENLESVNISQDVSSDVVYDNDFFMELDSNRRHDRNN